MENFPIEELELGVRSYNCLKRVGIETIGDLVTKSENELAAIPNFGKKSIEEVKETLRQHGLRLRGDNGERRRGVERCGTSAPARSSAATRRTARRSTRTLPGALIEHGRIKTTVTKAKAVKPIAEQMITLGRRGDLHARRQAMAVPALAGRRAQAVRRGRARASRTGRAATRGSSRIGPRPGDAAEMAYLELVDTPLVFRRRSSDPSPSAEVEVEAARAGEARQPDRGLGGGAETRSRVVRGEPRACAGARRAESTPATLGAEQGADDGDHDAHQRD